MESGQYADQERAGVSRRAVLAALGLGTAGSIAGYTLLNGQANGGGDESDVDPFEAFRRLRTAIKNSPDHLPERAAAAVASGDPERILAVVRDNVAVQPYVDDSFADFDTDDGRRWGVRGTLRGGAGTPRDITDTLAHLCAEAGFDAEVLAVRPRLSEADVKRILYTPRTASFDPDCSEKEARAWQEAVGGDAEIEALDAGGEASADLAATVREAIPEGWIEPDEFDFGWGRFDRLPVVRVTVDGTDHLLNPLDPQATFEDPGFPTDTRTFEVEDWGTTPVRVTLSGSLPRSPWAYRDLVSGEWATEDLVGRQLLVDMLPGVDPYDNPAVRYADVREFLPALTVQDPKSDRETVADLSVQGDPVTRAGETLTVEEDGTVQRDGRPLVDGDPADASRVATLSASAVTARYPEMRLEVGATDGGGADVEGLPASAFKVVDEEPVGLSVAATRAAPRVRVLVDRSGSMPAEYSGASMDQLVAKVTDAITDAQPAADVRLQRTDSELYTNLAEAAARDANVLVYVTDGDVGDSLTPEIEAALRAGPPAVMLNVRDRRRPALKEMARVTDGEYVLVSTGEDVLDTVVEYVDATAPDLPTYVLDYATPTESDAGETRTATVRVPASGAETTVSYTVPEVTSLPREFASLRLTVQVGGRTTTRTLGGWDPILDGGDPVTDDHIADVQGALFGTTMLSFEGSAPSTGVWLDDILTGKLSVRDAYDAARDGDGEAARTALEAGYAVVPTELTLLNGALPDTVTTDSLTYSDALRSVLYTIRPQFGTDEIHRQADVLTLTRYRTVSEDPQRSVRLTAERTARIAVVERALFSESAATVLEGRTLTATNADELGWTGPNAGAHEAIVDQRWSEESAIVPEGRGEPFAFWGVDRGTGAVIGILADGSGGGRRIDRINEQIERIDRVIDYLNYAFIVAGNVGVLAGPGAAAFGVILQYGQMLARLYGNVSIALVTMDASTLPQQLERTVAALACMVAEDTAFLGLVSDITSFLDAIFNGVGGKSACRE